MASVICVIDRLPGGLLRRPASPETQGALVADPDPCPFLDQLPDEDAGLGQPAEQRRSGQPGAGERLGSQPLRTGLAGQHSTVILGLVYGYLPFFILPLYGALDRIDRQVLEAARDLGASATRRVLSGDAATLPARESWPVWSSSCFRCLATTTRQISCRVRHGRG